MPPRWLSLLIVLFWLAATGWLIGHDLWPAWRPGEPPPFHIDLVEEVHRSDAPRLSWTVSRQGESEPEPRPVFRAWTWVDFHADDDTYSLRFEGRKMLAGGRPYTLAGFFTVDLLTSEYRVDRDGQLRSLRSEITVSPRGGGPSQARVVLWGEVRGEQFFAHCKGEGDLARRVMQLNLPPAPLTHNRSVLLPLHPVNRIHGLRPGQSWRQPLVDPFRDALSSLSGLAGGVREVNARVLPRPQTLAVGGAETTCLVIEYQDDEHNTVGRTWVERDTERVQQQEARLDDGRWVMTRDGPRRR